MHFSVFIPCWKRLFLQFSVFCEFSISAFESFHLRIGSPWRAPSHINSWLKKFFFVSLANLLFGKYAVKHCGSLIERQHIWLHIVKSCIWVLFFFLPCWKSLLFLNALSMKSAGIFGWRKLVEEKVSLPCWENSVLAALQNMQSNNGLHYIERQNIWLHIVEVLFCTSILSEVFPAHCFGKY